MCNASSQYEMSDRTVQENEPIKAAAIPGHEPSVLDGGKEFRRADAESQIAQIALLCGENITQRRLAAQTLSDLGRAEEGTIPALICALRDADRAVADAAAASLGKIGDPCVVMHLMDWPSTDDDWRSGEFERGATWGARRAAIKQIGAAALPWTLSQLCHANAENRRKAAEVLLILEEQSAIPALINALADDDTRVLAATIKALAELRDLRAVQPIVDLFVRFDARGLARDYDWDDWFATLAKFGTAATQPLLNLLPVLRPCRRSNVLNALVVIGDPHSVDPLCRALQTGQGGPDARISVEPGLLEYDAGVISTLGLLGYASALPALTDYAEHKSVPLKLRNQARRAIRMIFHAPLRKDLSRRLEEARDSENDTHKMQVAREIVETLAALAASYDMTYKWFAEEEWNLVYSIQNQDGQWQVYWDYDDRHLSGDADIVEIDTFEGVRFFLTEAHAETLISRLLTGILEVGAVYSKSTNNWVWANRGGLGRVQVAMVTEDGSQVPLSSWSP